MQVLQDHQQRMAAGRRVDQPGGGVVGPQCGGAGVDRLRAGVGPQQGHDLGGRDSSANSRSTGSHGQYAGATSAS